MTTGLILYMSPGSCSRVTMTALEETGVAYEARAIDLAGGEQQTPAYLATNRKGKVPAMVLDGTTLTENAAILGFLDRMYPQASLLPRSDDPMLQAQSLSDLVWCSSTLHIEVRQIRAPHRLTSGEPGEVRADGLQKFAKDCAYISQRVKDGWWYGAVWSIVDTYIYWAYTTAATGGFPLGDYADLQAHAERVRVRPAFQRMLAKERAAVAG